MSDRGLNAQHAVVVQPIEPTYVSYGSHHWPHVAYSGPYSSSLHNGGSVSNGSTFSSHWNNQSASEIPTSCVFLNMIVYYRSWGQHSSLFLTASSHVAGPDQPSSPSMTQRVAGDNFGMLRSGGSFVHPSAVDHG